MLLGCGALAGFPVIASSASPASESSGPVVNVTGGQVRGQFLPAPGGAVFKGIPYAAPPIGDLRWRDPQPVKAWAGIRQASEYGADCPPNQASVVPLVVHTDQPRGISEDCLFLNIWTPEWPSVAKLPVMVYLHSSELFGGTGA